MYRPVQTFSYVAAALFLVGAGAVGRFLVLHWLRPEYSGHTQSLVLGVGCIILAFMVGLVAMLSELLAANRRLLQELIGRVRRLDAELGQRKARNTGDIEATGAESWTSEASRGRP
jgi:hypothetical protein